MSASRKYLQTPTVEDILGAVLALGREVHLEIDEDVMIRQFLDVLEDLFPGRLFAVRTLDMRATRRGRTYTATAEIREGVSKERIALKKSSLEKSGLKSALAESARLRITNRWDSPFPGTATGFAIPLVASGELHGVLDVGYPMGVEASDADEASVIPMANYLSVSLRNERLHRETTLLRDYQARLIEYANALILGVDARWRITVCNRALCQLLGYEREELIGRDLRDWLPPQQVALVTRLVEQGLDEGPRGALPRDNLDVELPAKSGAMIRTVWSVATISQRGEVQAVVAIGQDQTKLRDLQNQVVQAEKLATLGQLAAGVVHEINNPLTSISVYAEYLLRKAEARTPNPDEETSEDLAKLRRINEGAQRILNFSRELVQYARPAGDEVIAVYADKIVRQALWFCEHLFQRSGVVLEQELFEELPAIYAVPGQLEQVVINLVTNAVHACEGKGDRVVVSTSADERRVWLTVSDSGTGVEESLREQVFEPFYSTKEGGKGTGLGLSIVKNIVTDHRGEISVGPSDLGGASFRCWFPLSEP